MAFNMDRSDGRISITVVRDSHSPPLPYELHGYVTAETWENRSLQIRRLCGKYSQPLFERIWFMVAFFLTTIFPLVIYNVIFNAIVPNGLRDRINTDRNEFGTTVSRQDRLRDEEDWDKYLYRARGISLGIEVGLVLMLWGPLIFWKRMGTFQANKLTKRWAVEDDSVRPGSFVPLWTIKTPGVFTVTGQYFITTPPTPTHPSMFHPDAYLPPYLYQQAMLQQAGGWQQQQNLPLDHGISIGDRRGAPIYAPPSGPPPSDEKNKLDFVDVKV